MKIAVVEFAGRGGLIHYAYQLCRALSAAGADVSLVTSRQYELERLPHAFRVVRLLRLWDPKPARDPLAGRPVLRRVRRLARAAVHYREWLRLLAHLRRERYDVVQMGDIRFASDVLPMLAVRALGARSSDVCHNVLPLGTSERGASLLRRPFSWVYRQFDVIFVHFEINRRELLAACDVDPARVEVIPHGNEELFRELRDAVKTGEWLRARLGLDRDDRVVLLLGTLAPYKGADLLLEALPRIVAQEPRARMVLAGFPEPGFDVDALRARAAALGLAGRVFVHPHYVEADEMAAWMELAEVAVFPYREVYQSGALVVAQTFGVPLVASAVGAMEDVVEHGRNGLLVPVEDGSVLAEAVISLLRDPEWARRMGRQAREDARRRFGWDRVAAAVLHRYAALAGVAAVSPADCGAS